MDMVESKYGVRYCDQCGGNGVSRKWIVHLLCWIKVLSWPHLICNKCYGNKIIPIEETE